MLAARVGKTSLDENASDDHAQVRSSTAAPSSPYDQMEQGGKRSAQPASQREQSKNNASSGVKSDARAA